MNKLELELRKLKKYFKKSNKSAKKILKMAKNNPDIGKKLAK